MSNYIYFLLIFELENRVFILGIRAGYNYFSVWLFLDKFSVFKSKDTAHTKSIGIGKVVIIESAVIQVAVIVISAALNRAWPYVHRVAVASICARAAAVIVTPQGAVTWIPVTELPEWLVRFATELVWRVKFSLHFRYFRFSDTGEALYQSLFCSI